MMCMWCDNGDCELHCDEYKCDGTKYEMFECNIVHNNAVYDDVAIEEIVRRWFNKRKEMNR